MKFSWQLINNFTNLDNINFNEFKEHLTLSGLEIDNVENIEKYKDKIIDLSITTNREEIFSSLSLAIEISTIFNIPITIIPIPLNYNHSIQYNDNTSINTQFTHIAYIRIIKLEEILTTTTPKWLLNKLKIYQINTNDILNNIKEYIKIKWGQTFHITDHTQIEQQKNTIKNSELIKIFNPKEIKLITKNISKKDKSPTNKLKLLIFTTITKAENKNFFNYEPNEFYENMFIDSIKLITTITGIRIEKYIDAHQKILIKNNTIKVTKKNIDKYLGYIEGKQLKFLKTQRIKDILQQLKLYPKYYKKNKLFEIEVPSYRTHDLKREIDIIEEIGRIYKFKHFFNKIKKDNKQGLISTTRIKVEQIRSALRQLGLHEVVNCCITKNIDKKTISPKVYNPMTNAQQELRTNILDNLINNYEHNIKHSKNNIEIFEIGKIFNVHNQNQNKYIETRHLSGLIHNKKYIRSKWSHNANSMTLFHFKSIMETLLETINSQAIMQEKLNNKEIKNINYPEYLFKKDKKIIICNQNNNDIIGIIGELDNKFITNSNDQNNKIYIFEINLHKLIDTTKSANHLRYISKKYSNYPSVTRDISIKIKKYVQIKKIKETILKGNNQLIESIDVFNEYSNNKKINSNKIRHISLRITYRSTNRTLNNKDIIELDTILDNKLKELQKI
nr:Phenylalanine-tRNA ligase beta subunit [Echinothamnion sp.]